MSNIATSYITTLYLCIILIHIIFYRNSLPKSGRELWSEIDFETLLLDCIENEAKLKFDVKIFTKLR